MSWIIKHALAYLKSLRDENVMLFLHDNVWENGLSTRSQILYFVNIILYINMLMLCFVLRTLVFH